ncbi:MAG TPA: HDOD domain-containing protein [Vicinamibacterales bacterium]|nr:HDOD domain-containing protein [Vicinamibacterales bacterium]
MTLPSDLVSRIARLDPMPVSAQALMKALHDDSMGPARLAPFIEHDPAMAAEVLRRANSVAFGGCRPTANVHAAVLRLGTSNILTIVLGGSLQQLKVKLPMYGLGEDELWLHSVAASLAVRAIQQERPSANIPDSASIAALLHDIGKLVMARYMKADAATIRACARERTITFVEAERETFGCDHTEVGAALARHWNLPDALVSAIECHHDTTLTDPTPTMDAVMVANMVAKSVNAGLGAEGMNLAPDHLALKRLGLDFVAYCRVILQTHDWVVDLKSSYGAAA